LSVKEVFTRVVLMAFALAMTAISIDTFLSTENIIEYFGFFDSLLFIVKP
jgi:hypothetical protein